MVGMDFQVLSLTEFASSLAKDSGFFKDIFFIFWVVHALGTIKFWKKVLSTQISVRPHKEYAMLSTGAQSITIIKSNVKTFDTQG